MRALSGPETRTMPMPPRPDGLAVATMVSSGMGMRDEEKNVLRQEEQAL